ncbi:hypothetical protein KDA23_02595, partial [Candidatus Saccharibacteria bacterium]|nr:hypothetical protein [Candidatus Saccharibacteria bacterium]
MNDTNMKTSKFYKVITELGLTPNEVSVYLAALSLGPSSVAHIARAAELERANVYRVIDSLQNHGLMSISIDGLKKKYAA